MKSFILLQFILLLCVFVSLSQAEFYPGIRPAYTGQAEQRYQEVIKEAGAGMREIATETFNQLSEEINKKNSNKIQLDLDGVKPFDVYLNCTEGRSITISPELCWVTYRIAQMNVAISLLPDNRIDKKNALGSYIMELARLYVAREVRRDAAAIKGRVPEVGEFLGLTNEETLKLTSDPRFSTEAALQWMSTIRAIIAHEIAHVELNHCSRHQKDDDLVTVEVEADKRARELLATVWKGDVDSSLFAHLFLFAYFYHHPDVPRKEVTTLCHRTTEELKDVFKNIKRIIPDNPDIALLVKQRCGIDVNDFTDAQMDEFVNNLNADCEQYSK